MRSSGNGPLIALGALLFLVACSAGAAFACSFAGRDAFMYSVDVYATTEARSLTVGERAAEIREETRLDNPSGIPTGFWVIMIFTILIVGGGLVYLFQGEKLAQAQADRNKQKRLLDKGQGQPARQPSPYYVIDEPMRPQLPTAPRPPSLPAMPPSLRQLDGGNQG